MEIYLLRTWLAAPEMEANDVCHNPIMGYSPKINSFFQNQNQKIK